MNNTQLVVRFDSNTLLWLKEHGFDNVQHLTTQNYSFPVIVVEPITKIFFGTNTTCMAALKPTVLELEDLKKIIPFK